MDTNSLSNLMGAMGRGGDNMMAHVTPGDVIIPRDVVLENPEFLTKLKKTMQDMGGDYRTHIAGSGFENINPMTGQPEFFFSGLKSFFKKIIRNPLAGVMDIMQESSLSKPQAAPVAPTPAPDLGPVAQEFKPTRPEEVSAPASLMSRDVGGQVFGALDPTQQRSFLATEGTFGGGLGDEEQQYYLNQLQRNLISEGGQLGDINQLLPIERTYLSKRGLPTDDTLAFFQALQS